MTEEDFFGDPGRISATRQAAELWKLLKSSGRYRYFGRAIGLNGPSNDTAQKMAALARIQGVGICYYCPKEDSGRLFPELERAGLKTDRHEHYRGGERAYSRAKKLLAEKSLPSDLKVVQIDERSPRDLLSAIVAVGEAEGVTPVPGSVMRGISIPGIVLAAVDGGGEPVASASSHQMLEPRFERGTDVFWGALATRPDRRGEGIALLLGAMAIVHMWENHGARGFITGVRSDNVPSQMLCAKLDVIDTEWIFAQCIDPEVLGSSQHTK